MKLDKDLSAKELTEKIQRISKDKESYKGRRTQGLHDFFVNYEARLLLMRASKIGVKKND